MKEPLIDMRLWRQFAAVAQELHFGRAALRLHMTQPPLTQAIAGLERTLGLRLFDRSQRRVQLTPAGAALLPQVLDLIDRAQALPAQARAAAAGEVGAAEASPRAEGAAAAPRPGAAGSPPRRARAAARSGRWG